MLVLLRGWPCYRAGGNIAMPTHPSAEIASTPFRMRNAVAVNPLIHPACIALDAKLVVMSDNQQVIAAEDYFVGPDLDITA